MMQRIVLLLMVLVGYVAVLREVVGPAPQPTPSLVAAILGPVVLVALVALWIWRGRG